MESVKMWDTVTDDYSYSYYDSSTDLMTVEDYGNYNNDTTTNYYDYTSSVSEQASHSILVASMVVFGITCVLGIPGNAFVIWIAGVKMKTVNSIWYVNLAVADLLCCLAVPFLMAEIVLDGHFPFGAAMCKVYPAVVVVNMYASVFTLTLISLDRFALIVSPVWAQNHRSISRAWLLCGLAWLMALLLSMPSLIHREIVEQNNGTFCSYADNQSAKTAINVIRPVFGFVIPLLVITVCYLFIARRVSVGRFKSQKALRIMVGVVTAFFVCWMPFHTVGLVITFGERSSVATDVARAVDPLVISLAYINSCLNPVLYVFMGQDFKKKVRVSLRLIVENALGEEAAGSAVGTKRTMSRVTNSSEAQV